MAFCTDQFMEAPLHVAASSLLRNIHTDYTVRFYFVLTGFSSRAVERLRRTLDLTGRAYVMKAVDVPDASLFRSFRPLHGNFTPYHRLILPEVVQEARLLYLDSDMQVRRDVSPLFCLEMGSKAMGFVVNGRVKSALEASFFLSLGAAPDDPAFNSGAMLFNLPEWHRQNCLARILEFCRRHSGQLVAADQTALNALYAKDCFHLDKSYNMGVFPTGSAWSIPENGIIHYVGSPKPWDIGGRLLLSNTEVWWEDLRKTAIPRYRCLPWLNHHSWRRLPRILGGYRRVIQERYRMLRGKHEDLS